MITDLANLTKVNPGSKLLDIVTAARVNSIQDLLRSVAQGENLTGAGGITINRTFDGVTITWVDPGTKSATDPNAPPGPPTPPDTPPGGGFQYTPPGGGDPISLTLITLELCDGTTVEVLGTLGTAE